MKPKIKHLKKKPKSYKTATLTFDLTEEDGRHLFETAVNAQKMHSVLWELLNLRMRNVIKYEALPDADWIKGRGAPAVFGSPTVFIEATAYWRDLIYKMLKDEGVEI